MPVETDLESQRSSRFANPFYFLLLVLGTIFCVTATAYGMMAIRDVRGDEGTISESGLWLLNWLDKSGARAMMIQLAALAVCTLAAITTDNYWMNRWRRKIARTN